MSFFFHKSATKPEKIRISLFLGFLCMSIFGMLSDVLLDEQIVRPIFWFSMALSIVCLPLAVRMVKRSPSYILIDSRRERWKLYASFAFAIPFLMYATLARGLPALAHHILAKPGEITVTIHSKSSAYRSRYCTTGSVSFEEYRYFMNGSLCGFAQVHWDAFKQGDQLVMHGRKSILGFSYQSCSVIRPKNP